MKVIHILCPALCDTRTVDCQAPLSIRFSRPEYWNAGVGGLSLLQGNIPNPGIALRSPVLQVDSLNTFWLTRFHQLFLLRKAHV